jgi:transcriptional regulator with XRE-family HTH domain
MEIYAKIDELILQDFCLRLKKARQNAKITQTELAKKSGLQRVHISRIENGHNFNMISLIKMLRALHKLEDIEKVLDIDTDAELLKLFES